MQGKRCPILHLSNNFARDLDEDTKDVFIQTSKAQVILIQLIYKPEFSSQVRCWAKINKMKFNSNQYKVRHFQIKKINDPRNKPRVGGWGQLGRTPSEMIWSFLFDP